MAGKPNLTKALNATDSTRTLYQNWRERFIVPLLMGVLVLGAAALIPAVSSANNIIVTSVFTAVYIVIAVVTFIRFPYKVRAWAFLFGVYMVGVIELLRYNILGDSGIFFLGMLILATMLLSPKAGIVSGTVSALTCVVFGFLMSSGYVLPLVTDTAIAQTEDWISGTVVILLFGSLTIFGFQRLQKEFSDTQEQVNTTFNQLQEERANLEDRVQERTIKLRRVNEIGRSITSILDPDELLARATRLISDEFECYFTAVFLLDITEQWADLKEATGDAGKVLRENKYRVDIKGKSLTSAAIRTRQARIALDTGSEPVRFDNPLLPYTRSQIAIPLAVGERIIGALEMHSTQASAFMQQDADTYQNMANEIAVALENARLFKEAQQSLVEMRATQRQYLQNAWSSLASEQNLEYSLGDNEPTENQIEVPLMLRDQIIGRIQMASHEELPSEQRHLIESIATQAALALENARLVEESQSIAARERLANEIISKVWTSTTMESILQTTVRELGRALEAAEVEIQVSMDNEDE
jgi:GAF domain-containing protein